MGRGEEHKGKRRLAELSRVLDHAKANYLGYSTVVGITAGRKYRNGVPTDDECAIQFAVTSKPKRQSLGRAALPRFLFGRHPDGSLNRQTRYATDVIRVGRLTLSASAGEAIKGLARKGVMTLILRNVSNVADPLYVLSCGHVLGDLRKSPPIAANHDVDGQGPSPFATTVRTTVVKNGKLDFDVGLAVVSASAASGLTPYAVRGAPETINSITPRQRLTPGIQVQAVLAPPKIANGLIESYPGGVAYLRTHDGRNIYVSNALLARIQVVAGDSGGLLFKGREAVGMVFGRSPDGWAYFHSVDESLRYIRTIAPPLVLQPF